MNWYLMALKKYSVFEGRASRKEYWYFTLVNSLIIIFIQFSEEMLRDPSPNPTTFLAAEIFMLISYVYILAMVLPLIAVGMRRLHDIDRSGWWLLLNLVPGGALVLIVFACLDSKPGTNEYGPNPKGQ